MHGSGTSRGLPLAAACPPPFPRRCGQARARPPRPSDQRARGRSRAGGGSPEAGGWSWSLVTRPVLCRFAPGMKSNNEFRAW